MTDKTCRQSLEKANETIRELESRLAEAKANNERTRSRLIRYERIVSSNPDLICLLDKEYRYRTANTAFLDSFGLSMDDIFEKHFASVVGEELFETRCKGNFARALAGETITTQDWFDMPGQGRRFLTATYLPITIDDNNPDFVATICRDVTELKIKEEDLQATAQRLDIATDAGNIGIWEWDLCNNKNLWDKKMYELFRVEPDEFESVYEGWRTRVHPDDLAEVERTLAASIEKKTRYEMEFRIVWPDGDIRDIKAAADIQTDEDGVPVRVTGVSWDVTVHRRMEGELRWLASTDPLTGASNRRHFMDRLAEELQRCRRYRTPMVLLSLDIDHFKNINDTYGHPSGDEVLKELVGLCWKTLRTTDVFGRVGGEEFLAALTQTGIRAGQKTAERLRSIVEQHTVKTHGHAVSFTISIGLTALKDTDKGITPMLKRADEALYKAKNDGRNRVEII